MNLYALVEYKITFFLSVIVVNFNVINLLSSLEPSFSIYRLVYESVH